jgi:hypothetical protein
MAAPAPAPTIVAAVLPLPLPIWLPMTPPTTAPVAALAVRFSVQAEVASASKPAKTSVKYLSFIVSNSRYPLLLQMEQYSSQVLHRLRSSVNPVRVLVLVVSPKNPKANTLDVVTRSHIT